MDDVAGCRLIFPSIKSLYAFREEFLNARFNHHRRNDVDKYDYIKQPKDTGYRGVHDVYECDDFVKLIENGCEKLSGTKRARLRAVRRKKSRPKRR